ncbi:hypothetical protein ACJX0J_006088, partial [Zea mays]
MVRDPIGTVVIILLDWLHIELEMHYIDTMNQSSKNPDSTARNDHIFILLFRLSPICAFDLNPLSWDLLRYLQPKACSAIYWTEIEIDYIKQSVTLRYI